MTWVLLVATLAAIAALDHGFCRMGLGTLAWGDRRQPEIDLTIDVPAGFETTPLRDILKTHGVPAAFFTHSPRRWTDIRERSDSFYRSSVVGSSLLHALLCRMANKRALLWDLDVSSHLGGSARQTINSVLFCLLPGSIVRISGDSPDTPEFLRNILPQILRMGYRPVDLSTMKLRPLRMRDAIQREFQRYERCNNRIHRIERVGLGPYDICRIERKPFEGPEVHGCAVDIPSIELHCESIRLAALGPFRTLRLIHEGLRRIAAILARESEIGIVYSKSSFVA